MCWIYIVTHVGMYMQDRISVNCRLRTRTCVASSTRFNRCKLPSHPLLEKGYRSVGCAPCTVAIGVNDDERAGRWQGRGKTECGLHTDMFKHKDFSKLKSDFQMDVSAMDRRKTER